MKSRIARIVIIAAMAVSMTACSTQGSVTTTINEEAAKNLENTSESNSKSASGNSTASDINIDDLLSGKDMFTEKDLEQTPDLTDAETVTVSNGKDITINKEGIYIITGQAVNSTITVEAGDEDKIRLVLDGLNITNESKPCIYVKSADKVFVTLSGTENSLTVTGEFTADGDTNTDAVIFSKDDLTINGTGTLNISSSDNAVTSKDTLKVTGGTLNIDCKGSALEAHESVEIADGTINITGCNDGIHAEDNDDDTVGNIYIGGGIINITAEDDAIHATTVAVINGGELNLKGAEGIEGTIIHVNDGTINIDATDDGINAAHKSASLSPVFEMNGGTVTIKMGAGDTDGIDSNGDIIINGGTIDITGMSTFDFDGKGEYNGGTIIENGTETNTITNQMMGGRGAMGGMGNPDGQVMGGRRGMNSQENMGEQDIMDGRNNRNGQNNKNRQEGMGKNGMMPPDDMTPPDGSNDQEQ